jgi:uncharacterized membrane protein
MENAPMPIEDLKKNREQILRRLKSKEKQASLLGKLAVWITINVGSMGFFLIIFVWTVLWLSWNIFAPKQLRFDPFPGFVLWLFISNMVQLFLMPLIMLGQNVQGNQSELRAKADLEINTQAALENETILLHLENQSKMMVKILKDLENKT